MLCFVFFFQYVFQWFLKKPVYVVHDSNTIYEKLRHMGQYWNQKEFLREGCKLLFMK